MFSRITGGLVLVACGACWAGDSAGQASCAISVGDSDPAWGEGHLTFGGVFAMGDLPVSYGNATVWLMEELGGGNWRTSTPDLAPQLQDEPGIYALSDEHEICIEVLEMSPELTFWVETAPLTQAGDSAYLGNSGGFADLT